MLFNKNKVHLKIFMKSGNSFEIRCIEFTIGPTRATWRIEGVKNKLVHLDLGSVEAVVRLS